MNYVRAMAVSPAIRTNVCRRLAVAIGLCSFRAREDQQQCFESTRPGAIQLEPQHCAANNVNAVSSVTAGAKFYFCNMGGAVAQDVKLTWCITPLQLHRLDPTSILLHPVNPPNLL